MHFDFSKEEMNVRGGVLDKFLETAFDAAIIIDEHCHVIHCSGGSCALIQIDNENMVGQPISVVDKLSPCEEVIRTGKHKIVA